MALRKPAQTQSQTTRRSGLLGRKRTALADAPATAAETTVPAVAEVKSAALIPTLPPMDQPALNANEPSCSYKIDFSDKASWFASTDGGATKERTGHDTVAGFPVDLALQINKAKGRGGFDQRLRLAFTEPNGSEGALVELNINAINSSRDGDLYVTSSGRSLVGALLAISDSEEDMHAFCDGARFRLRPGTGRGIFIEVDIAHKDRWVAMASPASTNRIAKDARGFHAQLELIKSRFRGTGLLLSAAAVIGEIEEYDAEQRDCSFQEIPVAAVDVLESIALAD